MAGEKACEAQGEGEATAPKSKKKKKKKKKKTDKYDADEAAEPANLILGVIVVFERNLGRIRINPKNYEDAYVPLPVYSSELDHYEQQNTPAPVKETGNEESETPEADQPDVTPGAAGMDVDEKANKKENEDGPDVVIEEEEVVELDSSGNPINKGSQPKQGGHSERGKDSPGSSRNRGRYMSVKEVMDKGSPVARKLFAAKGAGTTGFQERPGDFASVLFIARILDWNDTMKMPKGTLARSLGEAGEIDPQTEALLIENDVDDSEFSEQVLQCLPQELPWSIPASEFEYRRDFRKECVFTIDPSTARDLDDALSCRSLGDDVSYFVTEGTKLDDVAQSRATSVYLVQKILDEWFGRSVIRSCVKLSYDHAQMAKAMRQARFDSGALRLDQLKIQFTLDKESGLPNGYFVYQQRDSNKLVEEFMLLANMAVAHKIKTSFQSKALLRRHPPPQSRMIDELEAGPLEEKGMVMNVLDKSFDVYVLTLGVVKRVYCERLPLERFSHHKEGKRPELTLVWNPDDGCPHSVTQKISIFSSVNCVLKSDEEPLKWSALVWCFWS
nr:hypothetical protein BaRGS_006573 [Batillaria attramentaria]